MRNFNELFDCLCCCGSDHTVREGGSHIAMVVLNKNAFSQFLAAQDFWLDGKKRPPRAVAILCDNCMRDHLEPIWAVGRDKGGEPIYRVPVCELGDWIFEEGISERVS